LAGHDSVLMHRQRQVGYKCQSGQITIASQVFSRRRRVVSRIFEELQESWALTHVFNSRGAAAAWLLRVRFVLLLVRHLQSASLSEAVSLSQSV
jgi:hypothetical protein